MLTVLTILGMLLIPFVYVPTFMSNLFYFPHLFSDYRGLVVEIPEPHCVMKMERKMQGRTHHFIKNCNPVLFKYIHREVIEDRKFEIENVEITSTIFKSKPKLCTFKSMTSELKITMGCDTVDGFLSYQRRKKELSNLFESYKIIEFRYTYPIKSVQKGSSHKRSFTNIQDAKHALDGKEFYFYLFKEKTEKFEIRPLK